MDKPDVSSLLSELEPTTEYAEFLKLWPSIQEALGRQVRLKAIFEKLAENNLLSVSYVTFTRFVKKTSDEESADATRTTRKIKEVSGRSVGIKQEKVAESPPEDTIENLDSSEKAAAPARDALSEAQKASTSKNYARNVRRGS